MKSSSITDKGDKTPYICIFIYIRFLLSFYVGNDYEKLKLKKIAILCGSQSLSDLDWVFQVADIFLNRVNYQSPQVVSALVSDYVVLDFSALEKTKWVTDDMIFQDHLLQLMK